jgi:hypothetical protein
MARTAKPERITKFRRDLERLRREHSNDYLAEKSEIDPANLSSYFHGLKNPGEATINKFYMHFEEELSQFEDASDRSQQYPLDGDRHPSPEAEDPGIVKSISTSTIDSQSKYVYLLEQTVEEQKKDKEELRKDNNWMQRKIDQVVDNNTILARATETMVYKYSPKSYPIKKFPRKS